MANLLVTAPAGDRMSGRRSHHEPSPTVPSRTSLRVVGLFAGIGGIEKGLREAGHRAIRFCESDPAASAVLAHHFKLPVDADVRKVSDLPKDCDLVSAGFPCQDLSQVGRTSGFQGSQSSLVEHVFRLLRKRSVPWLLLENVPFMLHLHRGETLQKIVKWLEELGYAWAYRVIDSRAFGLPQRRRRVFLIASLTGDPAAVLLGSDAGSLNESSSRNGDACGFYWTEGNTGIGWAVGAIPPLKGGSRLGIPSPPAILLPSGSIVTPDIRDAERLQGFPSNWTLPALDVQGVLPRHRWRLVGNAVTVDVARWIGERLATYKDAVYDLSDAVLLRRRDRWPNAACGRSGSRWTIDVSEWPVRYRAKRLATFLKYRATPLSHRAAAGFLRRATASTLHLEPSFLADLRRHVADTADGSLSSDIGHGIK
jgi:DNA (cytosine-5)-methyltransferase 1